MLKAKPLRLGLLGASNIGRQFAAAVAGSEKVAILSVASRGEEKAAAYAAETAIPAWHGSYEGLLADPTIEAVYISLPNNLHAEWAIRALQAGKHVLCEKPLALGATQVVAMFDAARAADRFLAEGYPWLAQPQTADLRRLIGDGTIGDVRQMSVSFSAPFTDTANIRLRPENGGGALLDLGSYCVSLIRTVIDARPEWVTAQADWTDSGVDRATVATLGFANGATATLNCSFAAQYQRSAMIQGIEGSLATGFLNHAPGATSAPMRVWRGNFLTGLVEDMISVGVNGFRAEAESFAEAVTQGAGKWTGAAEQVSLDIAATLDAIADAARTGQRTKVQG